MRYFIFFLCSITLCTGCRGSDSNMKIYERYVLEGKSFQELSEDTSMLVGGQKILFKEGTAMGFNEETGAVESGILKGDHFLIFEGRKVRVPGGSEVFFDEDGKIVKVGG